KGLRTESGGVRPVTRRGFDISGCDPSNLVMSEAANEVVVHHPYRLHVGIADRRSHECESSPLQIRAHRVGLFRPRGNLTHALPTIPPGPVADELPHVRVERSGFLLNI